MFRTLVFIAVLVSSPTARDTVEDERSQILEAMLSNEKFTSTINFCRVDSSKLTLTDTSGYLLNYHGKKLCGKDITIETDLSYDYDVNRRRLPTDLNRFLFAIKNHKDTIYFEVYQSWGNGLVGGYYLPEINQIEVTSRGVF